MCSGGWGPISRMKVLKAPPPPPAGSRNDTNEAVITQKEKQQELEGAQEIERTNIL